MGKEMLSRITALVTCPHAEALVTMRIDGADAHVCPGCGARRDARLSWTAPDLVRALHRTWSLGDDDDPAAPFTTAEEQTIDGFALRWTGNIFGEALMVALRRFDRMCGAVEARRNRPRRWPRRGTARAPRERQGR